MFKEAAIDPLRFELCKIKTYIGVMHTNHEYNHTLEISYLGMNTIFHMILEDDDVKHFMFFLD